MTNDKILNWGILSTARINRRFIPPLAQATRSTLRAVASRNLDSARAFAREWHIPQTFGSYEALLADPVINAVYIPLPNSLHHKWVIKAAQAGKHILCEKPLALTPFDVDEMAHAARKNNVVLLEAFMYRMHPQLAKLKDLLASGIIGKIKLLKASFSFPLQDEANIRLQKTMGGGSLWDVGCYPVSFAQAIANANPVEVFGWQRLNHRGVEVGFTGQLRYKSGIVAQIDSGFDLPFRIGAEVIGETGVLRVPVPWLPDVGNRGSGIIHIAADDTETHISTTAKDPYLCEIEALERAALDGAPLPYTLVESRQNVATIVALYESAATGKVVSIGN